MFCRNCGKEVSDQAVMCVTCGVPPKEGKKFCNGCGVPTNAGAEICMKCGVGLGPKSGGSGEEKEWLVTLLLCILLGGLGGHRFYTGHIGIGIIQLVTMGGCYIWTIIDLYMILTGAFKDAQGNLLVKK